VARRLSAAALIVALAVPGVAVAQSTAGIVGTVQDSAGVRIPDVEIVVDGERRLRTDSSGVFEANSLQPGTFKLRARRIGYFPQESKVATRAGETARITIVLERRPVMLDTIAVEAKQECAMRRFEGFACRRRTGKGVYLDIDAIDSINPRFPVDVFRGQPGFRVDAGRSGLVLVATRGWHCIRTLVNGYPPSLQNPVPSWPNTMIAVEMYSSPDDVPEQYQRYILPPKRCSMIIYWTQVRPRRR
jgi:hypothetical protein